MIHPTKKICASARVHVSNNLGLHLSLDCDHITCISIDTVKNQRGHGVLLWSSHYHIAKISPWSPNVLKPYVGRTVKPLNRTVRLSLRVSPAFHPRKRPTPLATYKLDRACLAVCLIEAARETEVCWMSTGRKNGNM